MNYPDMFLEVSDRSITAALPVKRRYLRRRFSLSYGGVADLAAWMRNLGVKECCARIMFPHGGLISAVLNIALLLSLDGHVISLGWGEFMVGHGMAHGTGAFFRSFFNGRCRSL